MGKKKKKLWEKEKLLVTSNFSFSHSVFKRLVLQTLKNKGLFGKRLREGRSNTEVTKTFTDVRKENGSLEEIEQFRLFVLLFGIYRNHIYLFFFLFIVVKLK